MYSGTGVIRDTNWAGFVWEVYPPRAQAYTRRGISGMVHVLFEVQKIINASCADRSTRS